MKFDNMTRLQILATFGYVIVHCDPYYVATIKGDPEAFMVVCDSQPEAEQEAYQFLFDEVDPKLHALPDPDSFQGDRDGLDGLVNGTP